jgi:cytochrome c oxidase subunit 1
MMASTNLILDRLVGTHFFNQAEGGDSLLWQHLFWFFGHPEVYLIFLPAQGMMSMLIQAFSGRPVVGYAALVVALVATAFLGFGLWVHHMFTSGLPQVGSSFFTAASMMVSIPSGVQIFCWISTLWSGHVRWKTPLMYALGYFAIFIIGGLTGVMLASVPLDLQVHDTYFVVAHFHYVLIGGAVFPLFGMLHYWFPKMTGYMLNERLGHTAFWGLFIGFNLTFFPMHQLGLYGMPRRIYTYSAGLGWELLNLLATLGAVLMMLSMVVLLANVIQAFRRRVPAGDNPWDASTLEWATTSPPPAYNFHPLPTVSSRDPLWDEPDKNPVIVGVPSDSRDILITTVLDAEADHLTESPYPSVWPFHTSLAVTALFIGSIFTPWAVVWFAVPVSVALVKWFWPSGIEAEEKKPTLVSETAGHDFPAAVDVRPESI